MRCSGVVWVTCMLVFLSCLFLPCEAAERRQPNIILIMADDLGYECIGANGCEDYKTPVLDGLAKKGMRFSNCFANPLCTPSRVKIMTGKSNVRNYVRFGVLDRSEKTFAHLFKEAGYVTCIAGKWQLGREKDSPQHFGFDASCLWQHTRPRTREGTKNDSRFSNPSLEINGEERDYNNGEYGPDVCAGFICDFMEKNKDRPFLVYYPMILTHCPFVPTPGTPDWDPKSPGSPGYKGDAKYFADMVNHMDKIVGVIIEKLEQLKLREDTIVIFTGDNGTDRPVVTRMSGMKVVGGKGKMSDEGTRVPLIVSGPGRIRAGAVSDELVDFSDMLPTICEISGIQVPAGQVIDGVSFWSTLQGKPGRDKPWRYFWYNPRGGAGNAQVIARTRTRMVYGKAAKGKTDRDYQYRDCTEAYGVKPLEIKGPGDKEEAVYRELLDVIARFDKTRPGPAAPGP